MKKVKKEYKYPTQMENSQTRTYSFFLNHLPKMPGGRISNLTTFLWIDNCEDAQLQLVGIIPPNSHLTVDDYVHDVLSRVDTLPKPVVLQFHEPGPSLTKELAIQKNTQSKQCFAAYLRISLQNG